MTLSVRDSGPGIAREDRQRVFDRFYRGANAGARGSGLGLAIVKSIAERHGAMVSLGTGLAEPGLGVTITFPPQHPNRPHLKSVLSLSS